MKSKGIAIILTFPLISGCVDFEERSKSAYTLSHFSHFVQSCELYHQDYGSLPEFQDTVEFAEILEGKNPREGKNPKGIRYYAFAKDSRNETGQIIDGFGQQILIERTPQMIKFRSSGPDGAFGTTDDIELVYDSKSS